MRKRPLQSLFLLFSLGICIGIVNCVPVLAQDFEKNLEDLEQEADDPSRYDIDMVLSPRPDFSSTGVTAWQIFDAVRNFFGDEVFESGTERIEIKIPSEFYDDDVHDLFGTDPIARLYMSVEQTLAGHLLIATKGHPEEGQVLSIVGLDILVLSASSEKNLLRLKVSLSEPPEKS